MIQVFRLLSSKGWKDNPALLNLSPSSPIQFGRSSPVPPGCHSSPFYNAEYQSPEREMLNRSSSSVSASEDEGDDVKMAERRRGRKCLSEWEDCFHSGQNHRRTRRRRIKWVETFAACWSLVLVLAVVSEVSSAEEVDDDVYSVVSGAAHLGSRRRNSEPF